MSKLVDIKCMQVVEASLNGILLLDQGKVHFANRAAERILGKRRDELEGTSLGDYPIQAESTELELPDGEGGRKFVEVRLVPLGTDGVESGLVLLREITDQKDILREMERQSRVDAAIAELSGALLAARSMEEVALLVLDMARSLTGSRHGVVGYVEEHTGDLLCPVWSGDVLEECRIHRKEVRFSGMSGLLGWVLKNKAPLRSNTPEEDPRSTGTPPGHVPIRNLLSVPAVFGDTLVGLIAVANAEGGYSEWSEGVLQRLSGLLSLVIQRTRMEARLKEAKKMAEGAHKAKSELISGMSHELRTPLNAIIGFSEVLRDQYFGPLNEKQQEYVEDILESGKHLLSVINDILDLSRIEAGKAELIIGPVNVVDLIEGTLQLIKQKSVKHAIGVEVFIPEYLREMSFPADARKLKQVMYHLLSNAVKFTPDGGMIRVGVKLGSEYPSREAPGENGPMLEIWVEDNGIGLDEEYHEKVFEDFFQVKSGIVDKSPGAGLGLSTAKRLVEMHSGEIRVESEGRGKGCRFAFFVPLRRHGVQVEDAPRDSGRRVSGFDSREVSQ